MGRPRVTISYATARLSPLHSLRRKVDLLIYLSVAFGVVILTQLYGLVPSWLFYSVLGGWLAYLIVAILAATGHRIAYPLAFVLSILTLALSLPQPEHYSFMEAGMLLASVSFVIGSMLQFALLILIPVYLLRNRSGRKSTWRLRRTSANWNPSRKTDSPTSTGIGSRKKGPS